MRASDHVNQKELYWSECFSIANSEYNYTGFSNNWIIGLPYAPTVYINMCPD